VRMRPKRNYMTIPFEGFKAQVAGRTMKFNANTMLSAPSSSLGGESLTAKAGSREKAALFTPPSSRLT